MKNISEMHEKTPPIHSTNNSRPFVNLLLGHVQRAGGLASFAGPRVHGLVKHAQWQAEFGTPSDARAPWEYAFLDGCMYGCR